MNQARVAVAKDREEFKALWKICFGDSDQFINWFFNERFIPEYSVCLEENGQIVSCMQSYPYTISIRGKLLEGVMLAGVCTHPDYRGKGYMRQIFTFMMKLLRQKGIVVAVHTPAVLESYFSYGHLPVSDAWYVTAEEIPPVAEVKGIKSIIIKAENLGALFDCYIRNCQKYSGNIHRSFADFCNKAHDYGLDGGKCLCLCSENDVLGYCFYYETEKGVQAVEVVADNSDCYERLLLGLCVYYPKLSLLAKLPAEQKILLPFAKGELKQKGVMGVVNMSCLLSIVCGKKGYSIDINDLIVNENCGVYNLAGELAKEPPDIKMSAAAMCQLLVGYKTLQELNEAGEVNIIHNESADAIQRLLPTVPCYIIDEY